MSRVAKKKTDRIQIRGMNGGPRPGSGAKPLKPKLNKDGAIAERVSPLMDQITADLLNSKSAKIRRWAWKQLLPYAYRKQPMEITTPNDEPLLIKFT